MSSIQAQHVQRFLDLLKNLPNIITMMFSGDHPQDLFDRFQVLRSDHRRSGSKSVWEPTFILFRTLSRASSELNLTQLDWIRKINFQFEKFPKKNFASSRSASNSANFASANALPEQYGENSTERCVCERKKTEFRIHTQRSAFTQAARYCEQRAYWDSSRSLVTLCFRIASRAAYADSHDPQHIKQRH